MCIRDRDGLIQTQAEADEYDNTYDLSFISGKPWTPGDVKYRDPVSYTHLVIHEWAVKGGSEGMMR